MGTSMKAGVVARRDRGDVAAASGRAGAGRKFVKAGGRWIFAGRRPSTCYTESLCDTLRWHVADREINAQQLARAAGIAAADLDQFMLGEDDAISTSQAGRLSQLVGVRLVCQGWIESLFDFWNRSGEKTITVRSSNSLLRWAWRARRRAGAMPRA
jgi:hypothetical protein